ncbi:MAG: ABC transporter ATP-binding protein [Caldilineae bacterium]|nr:ABC transporter ATP-binding protein [Caldilineae bacterium]
MPDFLRISLRLVALLAPYKRRTAAAYGAMLGGALLNLLPPAILGWVIGVALTPAAERTAAVVALPAWLPGAAAIEARARSSGPELLGQAALLILALALLRGILGLWELYLGSWLSQRAAYDIRNRFFGHLQHLSFGFHDRAQSGDLMARAIGDISKVQQFLGQGLLEAVYIPVLFGSVAVVLFGINPRLAAVALSPLILLALVTLRFGRVIEPRFKAVQDQEGLISTRAQENFSGMRVVKAFAREPHEVARFEEANAEFLNRRIHVISAFADFFPTMTAIVVLAEVLVLGFGGRAVLAGEVSLATLSSFIFWVVLLAQPTQNLGFIVNRASEAVAAGRRLFEILDTPSDIVEAPDAPALPPLEGRVRFDHVSFGYADQTVLHDIDFDIPPRTMVALFGPTGSGKSTVASLIPRFYDVAPGQGAVRLDGHDVREVELSSLRCQVATVLQDSFLFSATIRDNIAYGRGDAEDAEVVAAAKAARAHDFIQALPEGYDTIVGERGVTLSGGQRQRVAIARALLVQPRILILDDATSAVDTETEHEIQAALAELMAGRTTFVIAQRLLTLKRADLILVLDQGRLVERGTHDELLAAEGLYARIYALQLSDQERMAAEAAEAEADR